MDEDGGGIMQNLFWSQRKTDLQYPQRPTDIKKRVCPPDPCTLSAEAYATWTKSRLDNYIAPAVSAEGDIRITATLDVREYPGSAISITKATATGEKSKTGSVEGRVGQSGEQLGTKSAESMPAEPTGSTPNLGDGGGEPGGVPSPSASRPASKAPSLRISAVSKPSTAQPPSQKTGVLDKEGPSRIADQAGAGGAAATAAAASAKVDAEERGSSALGLASATGEVPVQVSGLAVGEKTAHGSASPTGEAEVAASKKSIEGGPLPGEGMSVVGSRIKSPSTAGKDSEWVIAERVKKVVDVTDIRQDTTLSGKDLTRIRQLGRAASYPPRTSSGKVIDLTGPVSARTTIAELEPKGKMAVVGEICRSTELKLFLAISITSAVIWGLLGTVYLEELLNFLEEFGFEALISLALMSLIPITLIILGIWRCCKKPDSCSTAEATKAISNMTKSLAKNVTSVIKGTTTASCITGETKEQKPKELYKLTYEEALSHAAYQARCGSRNEPLNLRRDTIDTYRTRTSVSRRTPISKRLN